MGLKNCVQILHELDVRDINEHFIIMGSFFDADKGLEDFYCFNKQDGLQYSFTVEPLIYNSSG